MTPLLLCWLIAADPVPPSGGLTITRAGVTCSESVEPATVPLTGETRLTLTAEGAAPLNVEPVVFRDPPGWRVRSAEPATTVDRPGGGQRWSQMFHLTPDRAGDLTVQPPPIRVRAGGRETPVEIEWRPLTVHVTTTIGRADVDDARGVTGPEPAPPAAVPLWKDERAWAAVIVVIAVTTALLAGRRPKPAPAPEPPPAVWVAAELDRLGHGPPDAHGLASVLRGFLARQVHIAAVGTTTAELVSLLDSKVAASVWQGLLERCDVARFSNTNFTADEWIDVLSDTRRAVAESLPVAEPAGSAEPGADGEIT